MLYWIVFNLCSQSYHMFKHNDKTTFILFELDLKIVLSKSVTAVLEIAQNQV